MNYTLELIVIDQLIELLKEFKDVFSQTYKDLKCIPPKIAQHKIKLDTIVPIVKEDIDKLLGVGFIKLVEEATQLSPIMVVPKKNGKLKIYVDFRKINVVTKKDPYPLPFTNEVINTITKHEVYTFLDEFL